MFGLTELKDFYFKGNNIEISNVMKKITCKHWISCDNYDYTDIDDITEENLSLYDTDIHYKIKVPRGNIKIDLKRMFGSVLSFEDIICEQGKVNRLFEYVELDAQENGQIILTEAVVYENHIGPKCRMIIEYEIDDGIYPTNIFVTKKPEKFKYKTNEDITFSGMEVSEEYYNGVYKKTNNYNVITPKKEDLVCGYNKITVKQNNLQTTYTIEYGIENIVTLDIRGPIIYNQISSIVQNNCPNDLIWKSDEDLIIKFNKNAIGTIQKEFSIPCYLIHLINYIEPLDFEELRINVTEKITQNDLEKLHQTFPNLKILHLKDITANGEYVGNAIEGEQNYFEVVYEQ